MHKSKEIYNKSISVIKSCKNETHIEAAERYTKLAVSQIKSSEHKSNKTMINNLEYYLKMKRKALFI